MRRFRGTLLLVLITVSSVALAISNFQTTPTYATSEGLTENYFNLHLVTGWNLVSFPVVNENTTPNNVFTGLTYLENYVIYGWTAPNGPYALQGEYQVFKDNLGYWVWINTSKTVTVP